MAKRNSQCIDDQDALQFINAIVTIDLESVKQMLEKNPEMALKNLNIADINKVINKHAPKGYVSGYLSYIPPVYDGNNSFKFIEGRMDYHDNKFSKQTDKTEVKADLWGLRHQYSTSQTTSDFMKPIALCWTPAHKEIAAVLLQYGADINGRVYSLNPKNHIYEGTESLLHNIFLGFRSADYNFKITKAAVEYIKWLKDNGADFSQCEQEQEGYDKSRNWKSLYNVFYYEFYAASIYNIIATLSIYDDDIYKKLNLHAGLADYIFSDITPEKYFSYETYAANRYFINDRYICYRTIGASGFKALKIISNMLDSVKTFEIQCENAKKKKANISPEIYSKVVEMLISPVRKLLSSIPSEELKEFCIKEEWYSQLMRCRNTYNGIHNNSWNQIWDMLNKFVPSKTVKRSFCSIVESLNTYNDSLTRGMSENVVGKINKCLESLDGNVQPYEKEYIWPALASIATAEIRDKVYYSSSKREELRSTYTELCALADKLGADINKRNCIEGKTPVHMLCENLYNNYKNISDKEARNQLTVETAAWVLDEFMKHGADLSITDFEGRKPLDMFPTKLKNSIVRYMDYQRTQKNVMNDDILTFER